MAGGVEASDGAAGGGPGAGGLQGVLAVGGELAYVPPGHEPRLISHLIERVVAPGGRLILCAYRPRGDLDAAEIVGDLRAWGWPPGGEAGAVDPLRGGIATRIDWLDAPA